MQGVPSVGAMDELVRLFAMYGTIEEYRLLDEYPAEEFTDVYWIKYRKIQSARSVSFKCTLFVLLLILHVLLLVRES